MHNFNAAIWYYHLESWCSKPFILQYSVCRLCQSKVLLKTKTRNAFILHTLESSSKCFILCTQVQAWSEPLASTKISPNPGSPNDSFYPYGSGGLWLPGGVKWVIGSSGKRASHKQLPEKNTDQVRPSFSWQIHQSCWTLSWTTSAITAVCFLKISRSHNVQRSSYKENISLRKGGWNGCGDEWEVSQTFYQQKLNGHPLYQIETLW